MKHPLTLLLLGCLLLALASCNSATPANAVAYNDAIVDVQTRVVGYFDSFVMAADTGDSLSAMKALDTALDSAKAGQQRLQAMPPFDGNTTLRDAASELVGLYVQGLDKDWRAIISVLTNHNATLDQLEQANQVRDEFSIKEDELFKKVEAAQQEMATKYKFDFKK